MPRRFGNPHQPVTFPATPLLGGPLRAGATLVIDPAVDGTLTRVTQKSARLWTDDHLITLAAPDVRVIEDWGDGIGARLFLSSIYSGIMRGSEGGSGWVGAPLTVVPGQAPNASRSGYTQASGQARRALEIATGRTCATVYYRQDGASPSANCSLLLVDAATHAELARVDMVADAYWRRAFVQALATAQPAVALETDRSVQWALPWATYRSDQLVGWPGPWAPQSSSVQYLTCYPDMWLHPAIPEAIRHGPFGFWVSFDWTGPLHDDTDFVSMGILNTMVSRWSNGVNPSFFGIRANSASVYKVRIDGWQPVRHEPCWIEAYPDAGTLSVNSPSQGVLSATGTPWLWPTGQWQLGARLNDSVGVGAHGADARFGPIYTW